jgi:hypothetical protein
MSGDKMTVDESKPNWPIGWNIHVIHGNENGPRGVSVWAICAKIG